MYIIGIFVLYKSSKTMRKFLLLPLLFLSFSTIAQTQVYELRTYEIGFFKSAQLLHDYFEKALIPALNRQGVQGVGAFEETSESIPNKVYLLIPYDDINAFLQSGELLEADEEYLKNGESYLKAEPGMAPFDAMTSNLIRSTFAFPELAKPVEGSNLYELRIYTSQNEDALRRKVKMFTESEFDIFEEVGLPMVFFGPNIAGDQMPCLTYMLAFKDKEQHAEAWSRFGPHPEWQRIRALEEYANNMNGIIRIFMKPLSYSQL